MAVFFVSIPLNRVKKSPLVWPRIVPTRGFHCSLGVLYEFCVVWVIQNELIDWLISPCELILMLLL